MQISDFPYRKDLGKIRRMSGDMPDEQASFSFGCANRDLCCAKSWVTFLPERQREEGPKDMTQRQHLWLVTSMRICSNCTSYGSRACQIINNIRLSIYGVWAHARRARKVTPHLQVMSSIAEAEGAYMSKLQRMVKLPFHDSLLYMASFEQGLSYAIGSMAHARLPLILQSVTYANSCHLWTN